MISESGLEFPRCPLTMLERPAGTARPELPPRRARAFGPIDCAMTMGILARGLPGQVPRAGGRGGAQNVATLDTRPRITAASGTAPGHGQGTDSHWSHSAICSTGVGCGPRSTARWMARCDWFAKRTFAMANHEGTFFHLHTKRIPPRNAGAAFSW